MSGTWRCVLAAGLLLVCSEVRGAVVVEGVASVSAPVQVTHAGDERVFIVERVGRVWIYREGVGLSLNPFLEIPGLVSTSGEGGLLSIAFHPNYPNPGYVYVHYTRVDGTVFENVIARYTISADPDRLNPGSAVELLEISQPRTNHNGGQLQFSPNDGYLYISVGDGGGANSGTCNAQSFDNLLGSILRLDVDQSRDVPPYHGIPVDNPFGLAGEPLAEVWAYGLRNPWRFSFDRANGDLYIGDVGENAREEIDLQRASSPGGENYGWKIMEGDLCSSLGGVGCRVGTPACFDPSFAQPVHVYDHGAGKCSITGGFVYRGTRVPELFGRYIFGDYCTGQIWALDPVGIAWQSTLIVSEGFGLTSFGEDRDGELYFTVGNDVRRFASDAPPPPPPPVVPPQSRDQVRCIDTLLRGMSQVARSQGRAIARCMRQGSRGRLEGTVDVCTTADERGRLARTEQRLVDRAARVCAMAPDIGPDDPNRVNAAARTAPADLVHDAFGPNLDAAVVDARAERDLARCQSNIERGLRRCFDQQLHQFARCVRSGLRSEEIASNAELAACLGADPRGRIERTCDATLGRLGSRVLPRCVDRGVDLSVALPACGTDSVGAAICLERSAACRVCAALNAAAELGQDCDLYDDGAANGSCN